MKVPFNRPSLVGKEWKYIRFAISRDQLSGDGHFTQKCEKKLQSNLKCPRILLTSSCTHSLELAYLLADLKPGDDVILPSFTFPSTANAFVLRGARPRFVDIRQDTLNIDENLIEPHITKRTAVISPVHYAGVSCEMSVIMNLAKKYNLIVIEDAAQALGATYKGQPAGTFGHLNAVSFHETKNISCGEGGALIIRDPRYVRRAEIIRQKGTNRAAFYRGEVDKYSWVDIGSSYVPSELQAAFLLAQLEAQDKIWAQRRRLFNTYYEELEPYQRRGWIQLPTIPESCVSSYHLFHVLFENKKTRDRIMLELRRKGVSSIFHYFPLHLSKMGKQFGYRQGSLPVTEDVCQRLLRLPLYNSMTTKEQSHVLSHLKRSLGGYG